MPSLYHTPAPVATPFRARGIWALTCFRHLVEFADKMDARDMVMDYLGGLQRQGVLRQPVDDDARAVLRGWMIAARNGAPRVAAPQPAAPQQQAVESAAEDGGFDAVSALRASLEEKPEPKETDAPEVVYFRPGGHNADEAWDAMRRHLPEWKPLRELGTLRETPVFGEGNRHADIMMVGDFPGYQEEKAGRPMQGPAGEKLDGMLKAMGLTRNDVYLTTLVKFRPAQPRQTMSTRPASQQEIRASLPVLDFEIGLVQPKVIVAFGVVVARALLQGGNLPLSDYQGRKNSYKGVPVVVTHHPSYLLRTSDLAERRRLWEEMLRVMEMVGLPISDKQRGFFLPKK